MYLVNGVDLGSVLGSAFLVKGTAWRPNVATERSPVSVPGRHGVIGSGLPVFSEPKLPLEVYARASASQAALEAAVNTVAALLSQPALTVTRVSGGITSTIRAELESLSHDGFVVGSGDALTATLALPDVFFAEAAQEGVPASLASGSIAAEVPHLAGSSAPIRGAVARFSGPAAACGFGSPHSGTSVWWSGLGLRTLGDAELLFMRPDDLRAWITTDWMAWDGPVGEDVSAQLDYGPAGPTQLWPKVTSLSALSSVGFVADAQGFGPSTTFQLRAGRSFL